MVYSGRNMPYDSLNVKNQGGARTEAKAGTQYSVSMFLRDVCCFEMYARRAPYGLETLMSVNGLGKRDA